MDAPASPLASPIRGVLALQSVHAITTGICGQGTEQPSAGPAGQSLLASARANLALDRDIARRLSGRSGSHVRDTVSRGLRVAGFASDGRPQSLRCASAREAR